MTQVITAITRNYVLLAADRRLTFLCGPQCGQLADDDTCKLVSLCNICGIGYTGLAQIQGTPTHEWIARTLAAEQCSDPANASRILRERATAALSGVHPAFRRHSFVITGWAYFDNLLGLRPHICIITNMMDISGRMLLHCSSEFSVLLKPLSDSEELVIHAIGQPLASDRGKMLDRNLRKLVQNEISAKAALKLLVDEVISSASHNRTVGSKVLALCIPRKAAQSLESGKSALLASQPTEETATFCYFDSGYSELQQFGPTVTCRGFAVTEFKTENDLSSGSQSSSIRILVTPPVQPQIEVQRKPVFKRPDPNQPVISFEFGVSLHNAVVPGSVYTIPAAIKNTGDTHIVFARNLSDDVGQEVSPSEQGGAVPAITFGWPMGDWTISNFDPVSRALFAGVELRPGDVFTFGFGSFTVPNAPINSKCRSSVVDFSIRFTDTITGQLLNASRAEFDFPTDVNPTIVFEIAGESAASELTFVPARVFNTATGELLSGPVDGSPPSGFYATFSSTAICGGKPGMGFGAVAKPMQDDNGN